MEYETQIKINNYNGRNLTFTLPVTAEIESMMETNEVGNKVERLSLEVYSKDGMEVAIEGDI